MAQYDERVELDVAGELAKGQRIVEMRELFSPDTVDAGEDAYRRFETRFTLVEVAAVVAVLGMAAGGVVLVIRGLRRRRVQKSAKAGGTNP
jgi:hypothetical protein